MWNIGDRVWGTRQPGQPAQPGTIRHIQDDRCFVIFDDGEDALLAPKQLETFAVGADAMVLVGSEPVRVLKCEGDRVQIEYRDGQSAWAPLGRLRKPVVMPQFAPMGTEHDELLEPHWQLGDRVLACFFDLLWYPGSVLRTENDMVFVSFDDGSAAQISADKVKPLNLEAGERVEGRYMAGSTFYPGVLSRVEGDIVHVHYDDGDEETTLVRFLRLEKDAWLPPSEKLDIGAGGRLLACWHDGMWYPGILVADKGKLVHVLFDDGDQANLTWDKIRHLDLEVGDRVLCRTQAGPFYQPGEIAEMQGERIRVVYDEGEAEWTSIRLVRIERQ